MPVFRIGELLKARGLLNDTQVQQILDVQKVVQLPFGAVASEMFNVQEAELWRAWAQQMIECCPTVDPTEMPISAHALSFLTPREAWAYRLLPLSWTDSELYIATTGERLPNAMAFAQIKSPVPVTFAVSEREGLEATIRLRYGLAELPMVA